MNLFNHRNKPLQPVDKNDLVKKFSSGISVASTPRPRKPPGLGSDPIDITYDDGVNQNTNAIVQWVLKKAVEWLVLVIQKYHQDEFHRRMSGFYIAEEDGQRYPGFDFIRDFRVHNRVKYAAFMKAAKKGKHMITIDLNTQVNNLVDVLEWNGWFINPTERGALQILFRRLYNIIYNDIDIRKRKPMPKKQSMGERMGFFSNDPNRQIRDVFPKRRW